MSTEAKIAALIVGFILGIGGTLAGYATGIHNESKAQVATYNDGWTDGRNDLIQQQWNAHYSGRECVR